MPININDRLTRLNNRRKGMDRLGRLTEAAQLDVVRKSVHSEAWQRRASTGQPNTRYALGAMQEVDPDYTRISKETAERVAGQLTSGLTARGFTVDWRLQGSVPLNVHIRGVSDVDLLKLDTNFKTYTSWGAMSQAGRYTGTATAATSVGSLLNLRRESETILKAKYPAATVDCSGNKAIKIFGGSLARPVDVVPSHWFDNYDYQASGQEHDRSVTILDKSVPTTIDNLPFLHIKKISDRCDHALGGVRKAIRLCKNVKNDAEEERGVKIALSSFDIGATIFHADIAALRAGASYELAILAEVQRHLDHLTMNESHAKTLRVPDGSRAIFDTPEKLSALRTLSVEMDELAKAVATEQGTVLMKSLGVSTYDARRILNEAYIPYL
jgi:hypothetical protein